MESKVLTAEEFRPLYDFTTDCDDNFDIEECTVSCVDFSGSAEEYVAATGGPTADRVP